MDPNFFALFPKTRLKRYGSDVKLSYCSLILPLVSNPTVAFLVMQKLEKWQDQHFLQIHLYYDQELPLPIVTKLNVTALTYTRQIMSNQSPKPLLAVINKYQTEECRFFEVLKEFVLKKYIVALIKALNILLCKVIEAFMWTDTNNTDLIAAIIIIIKVRVAKTVMHVCLEIDHHSNVFNSFSETAVDE
ncbi:hypothetical protein AGLY_006038 [Aphis glycines]|uniref:Uncharacterized protein n=1 Tax=Aphis glycines TaxID=307491 RepID=A0A6G0TUX8_APHGL|nr:hypothetical protein AGLY_006038 [Aphis glycines]